MTEQVGQWICIKCCIKFEHSSMETIHMIQKASATGNWWLAASSWQHTCSCIMSCAVFFGETSNHSGDSDPLQPTFGAVWILTFPKIIFQREEISDRQWDSGKYYRAADWENSVRSQSAHFEVYWSIIVLCIVFLASCIFFNKYLYFSYYMTGHLLDRPHIYMFMYKNLHVGSKTNMNKC